MFLPRTYHPIRLLFAALAMLMASGCASHPLRVQAMDMTPSATAVSPHESHESMLDSLARFFVFAEPVNPPAAHTAKSAPTHKGALQPVTPAESFASAPDLTPAGESAHQAPETHVLPVAFRPISAAGRTPEDQTNLSLSKRNKAPAQQPEVTSPPVKKALSAQPDTSQINVLVTPRMKPYTVVAGDTMRHIAQQHLGDANLWKVVWKANPKVTNPALLRIGQVLNIPTTEPDPIQAVTPEMLADVPVLYQAHLVVAGETLSHIARHYLGDASRWPEIFAANPELTDPSRIVVGQVLSIPGKALARRSDNRHSS